MSGDPAKPGCAPEDGPWPGPTAAGPGLDLRGLDGGRSGRRRRRRPADASRLGRRWPGDLELDELSMGMSDDFEVAVAEGATTVRFGRVLFGPPPGADRATIGLR